MNLKESNNQAGGNTLPLARARGINIIQSSAEVTVKKPILRDLASGLLDRQQRFLRNSGVISMLLERIIH